jgi:nucleoid DNA-binding protein
LSRKQLIKQLKKKNAQLNQIELETILDNFSKSVIVGLIKKKTIEIRGFGRWYRKILRENFSSRNPATNKLIYKPERVKIRFKASEKLNKIINE